MSYKSELLLKWTTGANKQSILLDKDNICLKDLIRNLLVINNTEVCLVSFENNEIYKSIEYRKKYKNNKILEQFVFKEFKNDDLILDYKRQFRSMCEDYNDDIRVANIVDIPCVAMKDICIVNLDRVKGSDKCNE